MQNQQQPYYLTQPRLIGSTWVGILPPILTPKAITCPFCRGRGGFDGPEDCFDCAWCGGTGIATFDAIQSQVHTLLRERSAARDHKWSVERQLRECQDKLGAALEDANIWEGRYREQLAGTDSAMDKASGLNKCLGELDRALTTERADNAALRAQRDNLIVERDDWRAKREESERNLRKFKESRDEAQAMLSKVHIDAGRLEQERDRLKGDVAAAEERVSGIWLSALATANVVNTYTMGETIEETIGHICSLIANKLEHQTNLRRNAEAVAEDHREESAKLTKQLNFALNYLDDIRNKSKEALDHLEGVKPPPLRVESLDMAMELATSLRRLADSKQSADLADSLIDILTGKGGK